MAKPANTNESVMPVTPLMIPSAAVLRRPHVSDRRPPINTPIPIGVAVTSVKTVMSTPLKPRSSRRNSL